jgi:hypothetical protein
MDHPVDSYNAWQCPRAILQRRQYRTSIWKAPKPREVTEAVPFPNGPGVPVRHDCSLRATTMKFSATFIPLISLTLGIHAAAAADQIVLPNTPMHDNQPASNVRPTLFDLLTIESGSSIFFSYARELELSRLFVDADAKLTLLVPTNKAVMALARKP